MDISRTSRTTRCWFDAILRRMVLAALLSAVLSAARLDAGDWPQILGPNRNGIADSDEQLDANWPAGGPEEIWSLSVGHGYAGPAVQGDRLILFHRVRDQEVVEAVDVKSAQTIWKAGYATTFYPQVGGGDGPLCVPTIAGQRVITFGAQGVLTCFDLNTGKQQWQHDTHQEYRALEGYFGAGSTPIVIGNRVIVNVGGRRAHAGIVGFDLETGEAVWEETDEPAGYSAPVSVTIQDVPCVLLVSRYRCQLLDSQTGKQFFSFPFGQRGPTVNGATPVIWEDQLFVSSSYGIGGVCKKFDLYGATTQWEGMDPLATQYCTPIKIGSTFYAINGRDDLPPADFRCFDAATGKVLWEEMNFGYGTLIAAGDKILALKTDGQLVLIAASPEKYRELDRSRVLKGTARALPALAEGRLYLRDEKTLKCLRVGPGL